MKTIDEELGRVRAEISRLKLEEEVLVRLKAKMEGGNSPAPSAPVEPRRRSRSASIKPLVLELIHDAGEAGMLSADVEAAVKNVVPEVAKDTVGSVLSRLKSEGAFVYEQGRYFEKQFSPSRISFAGVKVPPALPIVN